MAFLLLVKMKPGFRITDLYINTYIYTSKIIIIIIMMYLLYEMCLVAAYRVDGDLEVQNIVSDCSKEAA